LVLTLAQAEYTPRVRRVKATFTIHILKYSLASPLNSKGIYLASFKLFNSSFSNSLFVKEGEVKFFF